MTKRVLLTGATGFIGRWAGRHLAAAGFEVHTAGRRMAPETPVPLIPHAVDLHDREQTDALVSRVKPSHLLHLAWHVPPGEFWESPENRRWVDCSNNLFSSFILHGGQRVVSAGTCAEYDWTSADDMSEEGTPLKPATLYGRCKLETGRLQEEMVRGTGATQAWARLFFLYGPGEPSGRLVSFLADCLVAGKPAPCTSGEQIRDFMYVDDAARALVTILESSWTGPINIATGQPVAVKDIAMRLSTLAGHPERLRLGAVPLPAREPPRIVADVSRLQSLGFRPVVDLEAGLRKVLESKSR